MGSCDKFVRTRGAWHQYNHEMQLFEVQQIFDSLLANVPAPKILEAGCGSASHYQFKPGSELVGIDISQEQLDRNKTLSNKILGDIQTYDLSKFNFDVIICRFVLEHLDYPEKALANFVRGLSHRGIIVLVAPNLFSLAGVVIKFTPFWFHRFATRILFPNKRTDATHNELFPTPFRLSTTPRQVMLFAKRNGLKVRYCHIYEARFTWLLRRKSKLATVLFKALQVLVKVFTLGKLDILQSRYTMVLERNSQVRHTEYMETSTKPVP